MAYSNEVYNQAKERLSERRQQALRMADRSREQIFQQIPRLREINGELLSIGAAVAKCIVSDNGGSVKELSERSLALQQEQEAIFSQKGIDASVFEPHFSCSKCEDTGYIELDNRTVVCDCLKKLMADIAAEELNAALPLDRCTFDSFSLSCYSDKPDENGRIPLNRMSNIYNYCVDYADNFSLRSKSVLMRGATGLGKTHLSLSIANEVIRKGWSVLYVSAPEILSKLEREHFAYRYDRQEETFNSLLKCDLLILDDLGTEFVTPFSISCVYNLFNSRILEGKPMIISTNLTMTELLTTYSQRFASRLIGSCDTLEFIGEDVRTSRRE